MTALPRVDISISRGYGDCDCCGFYDHGSARIRAAGRTLKVQYDGHMGGGCWDGHNELLHYWALQLLGVAVRVNGEPVQERAYLEVDESYQWQVVELCPQPHETVDLQVETAPHPEVEGWDAPVRVRWTAADGTARELAASLDGTGEWNGSTDALYWRLLRERAQLRMHERHEPRR